MHVSTPRGENGAKARSNEVYLCSPFREERAGKRFYVLYTYFLAVQKRVMTLSIPATRYRLRKWVDPPYNVLSSISLLSLMINITLSPLRCIVSSSSCHTVVSCNSSSVVFLSASHTRSPCEYSAPLVIGIPRISLFHFHPYLL